MDLWAKAKSRELFRDGSLAVKESDWRNTGGAACYTVACRLLRSGAAGCDAVAGGLPRNGRVICYTVVGPLLKKRRGLMSGSDRPFVEK